MIVWPFVRHATQTHSGPKCSSAVVQLTKNSISQALYSRPGNPFQCHISCGRWASLAFVCWLFVGSCHSLSAIVSSPRSPGTSPSLERRAAASTSFIIGRESLHTQSTTYFGLADLCHMVQDGLRVANRKEPPLHIFCTTTGCLLSSVRKCEL